MSRGDHYQDIRISPANLEKLKRYRAEVAGLSKVPIICPRCGKVADRVYADATGHKDIRCYYCKMEFISGLPQFRSVRNIKKEKTEQDPYRWW